MKTLSNVSSRERVNHQTENSTIKKYNVISHKSLKFKFKIIIHYHPFLLQGRCCANTSVKFGKALYAAAMLVSHFRTRTWRDLVWNTNWSWFVLPFDSDTFNLWQCYFCVFLGEKLYNSDTMLSQYPNIRLINPLYRPGILHEHLSHKLLEHISVSALKDA